MGKDVAKLEPWSFEKAVSICTPMVQAYKNVELNLVRELYLAKTALTNQGARVDLTSGHLSRSSTSSWDAFCEAIGIVKRTADRWILLYEPKEDRLLSPEEFKARKIVEFEGLIKVLQETVNQPPEWRPAGWSDPCERYYQEKLKREKIDRIMASHSSIVDDGPFSRELINRLYADIDNPTPEDIMRFGELCTELKPYATPKVKINDQVRVVTFVEKAIGAFRPEVRADVAVAVANMVAALARDLMED